MKRCALLLLFALAACVKPPRYGVQPLLHEGMKGSLDAEWFERRVYDANGGLLAIELLYCPSLPGYPTVCRTALVWSPGASALVEAASAGPPPVPVMTAPPSPQPP